jgi:hypothetical protein
MITTAFSSSGPAPNETFVGWEIAVWNAERWPDRIAQGTFGFKHLLFSGPPVNALFIISIIADLAALSSRRHIGRWTRVAKWAAIVAFAFACVGAVFLLVGVLVASGLGVRGSQTRFGPALPLWFCAYTVQLVRPWRNPARVPAVA